MSEESGFSTAPLVVSVDLELATLVGATRGAQLLSELLANQALDGAHEKEAPSGIFSILALVTERLGQLRRVIRNEESPAHLWAPHNAVADPTTSGEPSGDIVLFASGPQRFPLVMWSAQEMVAQEESERRTRRKGRAKGQASREAEPASSKTSQSEPATPPERPSPVTHEEGH